MFTLQRIIGHSVHSFVVLTVDSLSIAEGTSFLEHSIALCMCVGGGGGGEGGTLSGNSISS